MSALHANIQKDGTFSVVPQIPGGITSPAQLRQIAFVAEKYHVPLVKLTGGQRIDLLGIRKDDFPRSGTIWTCLRDTRTARAIARARVASVRTSAGSVWATASRWRSKSKTNFRDSTARTR